MGSVGLLKGSGFSKGRTEVENPSGAAFDGEGAGAGVSVDDEGFVRVRDGCGDRGVVAGQCHYRGGAS